MSCTCIPTVALLRIFILNLFIEIMRDDLHPRFFLSKVIVCKYSSLSDLYHGQFPILLLSAILCSEFGETK